MFESYLSSWSPDLGEERSGAQARVNPASKANTTHGKQAAGGRTGMSGASGQSRTHFACLKVSGEYAETHRVGALTSDISELRRVVALL